MGFTSVSMLGVLVSMTISSSRRATELVSFSNPIVVAGAVAPLIDSLDMPERDWILGSRAVRLPSSKDFPGARLGGGPKSP